MNAEVAGLTAIFGSFLLVIFSAWDRNRVYITWQGVLELTGCELKDKTPELFDLGWLVWSLLPAYVFGWWLAMVVVTVGGIMGAAA